LIYFSAFRLYSLRLLSVFVPDMK